MRLLVSGTTRTMARLASRWPDHLGHLANPRSGDSVAALLATGLPWGADNGCFSGFDAARFRPFLAKIAHTPRCLFVVCPDVVGDARATLALFGSWRDEVAASGQPVALVGQDGAEDLPLPWDQFDAWFVGGSTAWKLSPASRDLVREAKARGKHVHMGRVNSRRRLRLAREWGCDSVDGSSMSMFGDRWVDAFCRYVAGLDRQCELFAT